MSRTINIMVAARSSLIEKYKICNCITDQNRQTRFLEFYGGSELYDYFEELATEYGDQFRQEYFDDKLQELEFVPYFSNDQTKKEIRTPCFISVSVLNQELKKLWDLKIEPTDDKEYDTYLEEDRRTKIECICRLLGQIELFADSYEFIDIRLIFWIE